jgi:two-component system, cell cycle sensor histidine kinase and response regulator CckA
MLVFPIVGLGLLLAIATCLVALVRCSRHSRKQTRLCQQLSLEVERLHQAGDHQQLMFPANLYPMWIYDCESLRFLAVNDAAVRTYGFSREEFLAMTLMDIRPPEEAPALVDTDSRRKSGLNNPGVWRHRRKDGSLLLAEVRAFGFEENGRKQELVLSYDVTQRHQIEEALQQSQAYLRSLVDNAPLGICRSSVEGDCCDTANATLREMLGGYSLEECLRLKMSTDVWANPKDRGRMVEILRRNLRIKGFETSFLRRDGSTIRVRLSGVLIEDGDGSEHFEGYVEDMTEQSALEQQVRQAQRLEAVGRLAGGMAHDFNNVLVVIKLSTELMLRQITPDSPLSKPLLQVSNAADRAATLTRQMLAFGRQQMMQMRIINLNSVVGETIQMLRRVIGEDVQLVTKLADTVDNSRLDPDQVGQVIPNVAVNARDAMPEGGTLHIETCNVELDDAYTKEHPGVQPGRYVMVAVSDTGTGIDKAILPRIFDPFFTTKEVGKGTGLGLSIVYGIVKQSGGYIWVYSEPGHGTTFKLYFPATTAALEGAVLRSEAIPRPAGQTVLVVEDEGTIRSNVRECLQQLGYHVLEAESGEMALKLCGEHGGKIDVVLVDLVMPGDERTRTRRRVGPDLPTSEGAFHVGLHRRCRHAA